MWFSCQPLSDCFGRLRRVPQFYILQQNQCRLQFLWLHEAWSINAVYPGLPTLKPQGILKLLINWGKNGAWVNPMKLLYAGYTSSPYQIYHFYTSDQRKPQWHISHITPITGWQDITLATMPLILMHTFKTDSLDASTKISTVCFI